MKYSVAILGLLSGSLLCAETARDYYQELYAAGGLGQIFADRVCFDDRPELDTFFLLTENKVIREVMTIDGSFAKAPKSLQAQLSKDMLITRGYDKGVPIETEEDLHPDTNGSWVGETFMLDKNTPARIRINISFETLRYKRSVEILTQDGTIRSVVSAYGRCEYVAIGIRQHGK